MGNVIDFQKARAKIIARRRKEAQPEPKRTLRLGTRTRRRTAVKTEEEKALEKAKAAGTEISEGFTVQDAMALGEVLNNAMMEVCDQFGITMANKSDLFLLGESIVSMVLRQRNIKHPLQEIADQKYRQAMDLYNNPDPEEPA